MYDNNGDIFGFVYNGTEYYYVKNAQNDVVAIANSSGTVIANYYYDAWGKIIDITGNQTIANLNPIRYRSYYYDSETGFYYIFSRYYDSEIGRWISPEPNVDYGGFDENAGLLAYSVYAYCANNPVIYYDPTGEGLTLALAGAGSYVAGTAAAGGANFWNPIGWTILGLMATATVIMTGVMVYNAVKSHLMNNPDPYARPGQKKQNRELKNKSRKKEGFTPRNNKRNGKPAKPKKHTPSRKGHKKY